MEKLITCYDNSCTIIRLHRTTKENLSGILSKQENLLPVAQAIIFNSPVLNILYLGWLNLFHNGTIMHMTPREQVIDMYKTFRALEQ